MVFTATPLLGSSQAPSDSLVRQLRAEGSRSTGRASHTSSQEYQEEISNYYSIVRDLVSTCLASLSVVQADENDDQPDAIPPQIESALRLLEHLFVNFPDIITFSPPSQQSSQAPNDDQFHLWLLMSLLTFLGHESCRPFHEQVVVVVGLLLDLIKAKVEDIGVFQRVVLDILMATEAIRRHTVEVLETVQEATYPFQFAAFISASIRMRKQTSSHMIYYDNYKILKTAESSEPLISPYEITLYTPSTARQLLAHLIFVIAEVFKNNILFLRDLEPQVWRLLVEILKSEVEVELKLNEDGLLRLMAFRSTIRLLTILPVLPPAITNELICAVVTHVYYLVTDVDFRPPNQLDLEEAMAECLELILKQPLSPPQLRAVASAIEQSIQLAVVLKTLALKNALLAALERLLETNLMMHDTVTTLIPWLEVGELQPVILRCLRLIVQKSLNRKDDPGKEADRKVDRVGKRKAEDADLAKLDNKLNRKKSKMTASELAIMPSDNPGSMDVDGASQSTKMDRDGVVPQLADVGIVLFDQQPLGRLLQCLHDATDEESNTAGSTETKQRITISQCWKIDTIVQVCLHQTSAKKEALVVVQDCLQRFCQRFLLSALTEETDEQWRMGTLAILCRTISKFALDDEKNMANIQNQLFCILSLPWLHQMSDETFRRTHLANDANWMAVESQNFEQPSASTSLRSSMSYIVKVISGALNYQLMAASQVQIFDIFKGLACWTNLKAVCLPFIAAVPFAGEYAIWFVDCYVSSLSFVETDLAARTCAWQLLPIMYVNNKEASSRTALLKAARVSIDDPSELLETVAQNIGWLACARTGQLSIISSRDHNEGYGTGIKAHKTPFCLTCDQSLAPSSPQHAIPMEEWASYAFLVLYRSEPPIRTGFMRSLRRMLRHARLDDLDLKRSVFGSVLVNSMSSGLSELRILTGDAIAIIFEDRNSSISSPPSPEIENTRFIIMRQIKELMESSNKPELCESLLITIGRIGRVADDAALSSSIICFLGQLGSENIFVRSVAVEEIVNLAKYRKVTTAGLFEPFIPCISRFIIDSLITAPPIVEHVAQLLNTTPAMFLNRTMEHTLPHLIGNRNDLILDYLSRVMSWNIPDLCIHMAHDVLAHLFMHEQDDEDDKAMLFLREIASKAIPTTITNLLRSCTLKLIVKLAVELGDEDEETRRKAIKALKLVQEKLVDKQQSSTDASTVQSFSAFLLQYFLGVLKFINRIVIEVPEEMTWAVKKKTIRSLEELIKLIGSSIYSVTSPILATLQTLLDFPTLQDVALTAWAAFIKTLNIEHIIPLLNQIVIIMLNIFPDCNQSQRQLIVRILEYLIIENADQLKPHLKDIVNIPNDSELSKIKSFLNEKQGSLSVKDQLSQLVKRVCHENPIVAHQALIEMKSVLESNQTLITSMILAETVDPVINDLFSVLLEGCRKFNGTNLAIQRLCSDCLGIVGAVDPSRLDVRIMEESLVMLSNFVDREESVDFTCKMIETHLVRAFRSLRDPRQQEYFTYAIQELLKFCGFTAELLTPLPSGATTTTTTTTTTATHESIQQQVRQRWDRFPKLVREAVSPLLNTGYSVKVKKPPPPDYPIYLSKQTFKDWLQSWTIALIYNVTSDNACQIFRVCGNMVQSDYVSISLYLLPHLVLNILISGTAENRKEILSEILAVLNDVRVASSSEAQEMRQLCCQTIFSLMDHFTKWLRLKRRQALKAKVAIARRAGKVMNIDEDVETDVSLQVVDDLLSKIPQNVMAEASYRCEAYARALMHFEQHIRSERKNNSGGDLQPLYAHMQRIYAHIDEPDGMEGITSTFQARNLEQQILEDESAGRWTAAQTCYELSLQEEPSNLNHQLGLINCFKNLGHLETMLTHINGVIAKYPQWSDDLTAFAVEASWRLGNWVSLEQFLNRQSKETFEVAVGKILLSMRRNDETQFLAHLQAARNDQMSMLAAASMESYRRGYDSIVKLHMLYEIEATFKTWQASSSKRYGISAERLAKDWDKRLEITLPSFKVREPILNLRRILLHGLKPKELQVSEGSKFDLECGRIWLQSAKTSRKAGYFQTAYSAILHATKLRVPFFYVERARWLWHKGQDRKAIQELQGAILNQGFSAGAGTTGADVYSAVKDVNLDTKSEAFMRAKAALLLAKWTEDTSQGDSNTILKRYMQVIREQSQWEKGHYYLGRYYNKLYINGQRSNSERSDQLPLVTILDFVCKNYGRALFFGTRYIYQTMPRLLTMWLDFGATIGLQPEQPKQGISVSEQQQLNEEIATKFRAVNQRIREFSEKLPPYQFLTAFPQIISRICHRNRNVFDVLEKIIIRVLTVYPHQALWSMMSVSRSTYSNRKTRCNDILSKVKSDRGSWHSTVSLENLIQQAMKLTDQLLTMCNFTAPPQETVLSITKDFRNLQRITPLNIIIPLQATLTPTLPASAQTLTSHKPFPTDQPTILRFQDEVEIINSLQKPRKFTIVGSNGQDYIFLCKPKDDLRKDARLMEFNSMINKLLKKDPESRRRQLHIRTYAVVPLNEECGLIEWVNNTAGLRHIVNKLYRSRGLSTNSSEIRTLYESVNSRGVDIFTTQILPKVPPVFHEWFLETFPEPTSWFTSRLAYATTTAVMSIVGYIIGLGDRHGENILFDETNGDCVHVDFNCLFEKGMTFERPERVPFRLTQNMVDAFGVTGYEGLFRRSCEVSLNVLRNNKESLMSVLETFIHDPLCEWSKKKPSTSASGEVQNEQAVKSLQTIRSKLQGVMQTGLPVSIEGQTQELIRQATCPKNLFQMYIGWASYM